MDNHRTSAAIAGPIAAGTSRRKLLGYGMIGLSAALLAGCVYRESGMDNDRGRPGGDREMHGQYQDRDREQNRHQDQYRDQDHDGDQNRR